MTDESRNIYTLAETLILFTRVNLSIQKLHDTYDAIKKIRIHLNY